MARYSIFVLGESNISLTGGVTLDGITQGDGSHLIGEFLTINNRSFTELFIRDGGSDTNFADNDSNQRLDGAQTLEGVTYGNSTRIEAEYEFIVVDDNTGIEYTIIAVNLNNSSPAYATNEALAFVGAVPPTGAPLRVIAASEGPLNSGADAVDESEIVPICFCEGTLIETVHGPKPVESLSVGDRLTRPDGTHTLLRCILKTRLDRSRLARNPKLLPVRITAGALGAGLPRRDLSVSRQHRVVITSKIAERMFGQAEVLVSAIRLTELPGVFIDETVTSVTYVHLLTDTHEIILAEGAPTESLLTGPEALKSLDAAAREEVMELFPELARHDHKPRAARIIPPPARQRQLIQRHAKNAKPVC